MTPAAVGDAVAEHADARNGGRLSGNGAVRGHERLGGARHDAAVRAHRRAMGRCGGAGRRTRHATICLACTSGRPSSNRRFRSTPRQACGGVPDSRARPRRVPRRRNRRSPCSSEIRAQNTGRFQWRQPPYEYELRSCRSTSSPDRASCGQQIEAGLPVEAISDSWMPALERLPSSQRLRTALLAVSEGGIHGPSETRRADCAIQGRVSRGRRRARGRDRRRSSTPRPRPANGAPGRSCIILPTAR